MSTPNYSIDDLARALHALMPRGPVWPREESGTQHKVIKGLAGAYSRITGRGLDLLSDANPATTYELLREWEETLGLPGTCGQSTGQTVQDRQSAVVAALIEEGGQTPAYFIRIAATLGYSITITTFSPFRVTSRVDAPLCDSAWSFAWQVNGAAYRVTNFSVNSTVDEPLASWSDITLACVFERIKPAHTTVIFNNT